MCNDPGAYLTSALIYNWYSMFPKSATRQTRPARASSLPGKRHRWRLAMAVALVGLTLFAGGKLLQTGAEKSADDILDYRMPVANPVLDPDRPDLIGEPRIDE